jgi:membrane fusion protein (multidrug efflux system)
VATKLSIREFVLLLPLVILLAPLAGCGVGEAGANTEESPAAAVPVVTATPVRGPAYAFHAGTTHLETDSEAAVVAKVGGEIVQFLVEEGQSVKAGQVVARLDKDRYRLLADQAKADLNRLSQEYRRNVQLHERGLVSQGAFENLRFDLEAMDAAYKLASLDLEYTDIRASIDGVVSEKVGRVGNTVAAGDVVLRISDSSALLAYLRVPQRDLFRFSAGQKAELTLDALPGQPRAAEILRVSPRVDSETGTVKLSLGVGNSDGQLRPGMFARVRIVYDVHDEALLVPASAVLAEDAQPAVFVLENGIARRREVTTGLASGEKIEVTSGLQGTEQVIVVGQEAVRDGTPVIDQEADGGIRQQI